jgi:hypothetical protein
MSIKLTNQLESDNQRLMKGIRILKGELKKLRECIEHAKQCIEDDDGHDGEDIVLAVRVVT